MFQAAHRKSSEPKASQAGPRPNPPVPIGNQAMLRRLQAKLAVSQPGDPDELEADRVADQAMRMPDPAIRRKCAECEEEDSRKLNAKSNGHAQAEVAAPPMVHQVLNSPGQPLDGAARAFFEPRFGADFSPVRVHADSTAADSARSIGALAFTVGRDIVFASGQYAPHTAEGQKLLAHELTHTIQQSSNSGFCAARQCDPAWAGLDWAQRVANVTKMPGGAARNQCMTDMIQEALTGFATVNESTNTSPSMAAAVSSGKLIELGSPPQINFDNNLNAKTKNNLFGDTAFQPSTSGGLVKVFVALGPKALNAVGPDFTRKAYQHEKTHADDFIIQDVTKGQSVHRATPGEELAIYTLNFTSYFPEMWTIDNKPPCGFTLADDFPGLFENFAKATPAEQDSSFEKISAFFDMIATPNPCNLMKFKIWLQAKLNANSKDPLVTRLNSFPGMSLTKGARPQTFLICPTPCP